MKHLVLTSLFAVVAAAVGVAQTTTLQFAASRDNTLYQDPTGSLSNGAGQYLFVGLSGGGAARRALLKFDVVAAIPPRSRIVDVQLRLVSSRSLATAATTATLHRVTADWGEANSVAGAGEGGGGPALPGDATWTHAMTPTVAWTQLGGDFDATPSSSVSMPPLGAFTFTKTEELIADVQHWLNGSRPNHGWLVKTPEASTDVARRLDSRDNTSPTGVVPQLTITFLPPGAVETFGTGCITSGNVPFTQAMGGQVVQGQTATLSLSSGVPLGLVVTLISYDVRPYSSEIAPNCDFWLRSIAFPTLLLRQQDAAGTSTDSFPIPFNPALFGTPMALQTILLDFASPRQYALSNAHLICIR